MVEPQEKQPFDKSIVKKIRHAESAEKLCDFAKTLMEMLIPPEYLRWACDTFDQRVTELLWGEEKVPPKIALEIEQIRSALGKEGSNL